MKYKRIVLMLMLSIAALAITLACSVSASVPFIAQAQPTATKRATRTPRATFTPRPAATEIPTLAPTETPTEVPPTLEPTKAPPTARPVTVRPTARPKPTNPPEPTAPPATPAPQYPYKASIVTCTHAGNAYIKGSVCSDNKCNAKLSGMTVVMSDAPFGTILDKVKTDVSGDFTFTRNGSGPVGKPENWYIWVVNGQDQPLSDAGGPVPLDQGHDSDELINKCPNTAAFISFFKP
jgi:hypothetical protein